MADGRMTVVGTRKFNFTHMMCFVVLYEDRVVLAHIDDDKRKEIAREFKEERISQGITEIATLSDMIHMLDHYARAYNLKEIEDILVEDDMNVEIPTSEVKKVVFTKSHYDYQKEDGQRKEGKLVITTNENKYKLTHKYLDDDEEMLMELRATFGDLLK